MDYNDFVTLESSYRGTKLLDSALSNLKPKHRASASAISHITSNDILYVK